MTFLDDLAAFLEQRLDDFIRANPGLELNLILLDIQEQERHTLHLLQTLEQKCQTCEKDILGLVEDIRRWHDRVKKAEAAGRADLAKLAREKEEELRQRGQDLWGQRTQAQAQVEPTRLLLAKIRDRRKELETRIPQPQGTPPPKASYTPPKSDRTDPIEAQFRNWELEAALKELKTSMGL
ncbi:TIGR04376 family protein [Candidatus Synechococcus calcipolaris G9]|uniref:TIGR04376 family protein n=1 Tax=Candidatus Synechococcus calcipolaris G9 TaxID=1497997 RepID=A0ABT6EZ54_9SYNE|nr:TIGR04376 family protein [Candidatus Synechococcus calcipolaris]MDG2990680.1 TIGR04376 family protein [Candidatus Synechococcus calcipolaris G9]